MGFVHDQEVVFPRIDRLARSGQRFAEKPRGPFSFQEVDAGDEAWIVGPGVDVDAPATAQVAHQARIDDAEVEAELVAHLVAPLDLQGGRADNEDLPGSVADNEFQRHQARFDGFSEAHIVGDKQVDPGHLDRPDDRVKLVVFDLNPRAERGLDVLHVGGRCRPPADGVQKGVEPLGSVEAGRFGQGDFLNDLGPRLDLPDDLDLLAQAVILDRGERQQVMRRAAGQLHGRERQETRLHHVDYPRARPHLYKLALLGRRRSGHHGLVPSAGQVCCTSAVA